jgi:hypothetical protein
MDARRGPGNGALQTGIVTFMNLLQNVGSRSCVQVLLQSLQ